MISIGIHIGKRRNVFSQSSPTDYIIMSIGTSSIRKGIRNSMFVVDKTITETGFAGIQNTDWENITSYIL